MQGNLSELDLGSLLHLLQSAQSSGELYIQAPSGQDWSIYLHNGQINYATVMDGEHPLHLQSYLSRYSLTSFGFSLPSLQHPGAELAEYAALWDLLDQEQLTPAQARELIQAIVQDILFDLWQLEQGWFCFTPDTVLARRLVNLEITALTRQVLGWVRRWKSFFPDIRSPDQYLWLAEPQALARLLPPPGLNCLQRWAEQQTPLRQLARSLGQDVVTFAQALYPYIQQGWLRLASPTPAAANHSESPIHQGVTQIVYVSRAVTDCQRVAGTLRKQGYAVTAIAYPLQALNLVLQLQPDLILCDGNLVSLNGYQLCQMFHSHARLRYTPVILLTQADGWIEQARARRMGASHTLTQPFTDAELLNLVSQVISFYQSLSAQNWNRELLPKSLPDQNAAAPALFTFPV